MDLLLFVTVSAGFTLIPGPNATLIISTSMSHGVRKGLKCAFGVSCGVAIHLLIALFSTSWVVQLLVTSRDWLIWLGILILSYWLIKKVFGRFKTQSRAHLSGAMSIARGAALSLTNPKGIIFFAVVMPPFINRHEPFGEQAFYYSVIFLGVVFICDLAYAIFAGQLVKFFHRPRIRHFLRRHTRLIKIRIGRYKIFHSR